MKRSVTLILFVLLSLSFYPTYLNLVEAKVNRTSSQGFTLLAGTVDIRALPAAGQSSATPQAMLPGPLVLSKSSGFGRPGLGPAANPQPKGSSPSFLFSNSVIGASSGFDGLTQGQSGGWTPPDPQVAAGPNHIFELVNLEGEIYSRQNSSITTFTLNSFFKTGSDFISDPKVLYDQPSGRWFASILDVDNVYTPSRGAVIIAVSTTSDPYVWKLYSIADSSHLPDQPILGISDDKVVASVNDFTGACGTCAFLGAHYWVLNKSQIVAGNATVDFDSYGPNPTFASVHPVQLLSSTTTQYMISAGIDANGNANKTATLFSVTGLPHSTSVHTTSFTLSGLYNPPNGLEPGGTATVNTDDARVSDAEWFQGKLWFGFTIGCYPSGDSTLRACLRLSQIDTSTLTLKQDFNYSLNGFYYFYPALRVDSSANLEVVYGYSSATNSTCCYPSLAVAAQASTDPVNSITRPATVRVGQTTIGSRYGDYFGAGVDPVDQSLVWFVGEYGGASPWSTYIGSMSVSGFSISANSTGITVLSGTSQTSKITLSSLNGFSGTVNLTGITPSGGPSVSFASNQLSLGSGGTVSTTLAVNATASSTGNFIVGLKATSGAYTRWAPINVAVVDFSLTGTPSEFSLGAGSSANATLTLKSINGFKGTISLTTQSQPSGGPSSSVTPNTITLAANSQAASTLTMSTSTSTPHGLYSVTVTGTTPGASRTFTVTFVVAPFSVTINNSTTFTGITVRTTGTLSVDYPSNVFTLSGSVQVQATNRTTGSLLYFRTYPVTSMPFPTYGFFLGYVGTNPNPLSSKIGISMYGTTSSSSVAVSRNRDINVDGVVDKPDLDFVNAHFGCSIGASCYSPQADLNADGTVNIIDIVYISASFGMLDLIPNFALSSASLTFLSGSSGSTTVTVSSYAGFAGTVTITKSVPTGLTATLSPTSVTVPINGTATVTLTVSSSKPGFYGINITGTSGVLSHTITIRVNVADFSITAFPDQIGLKAKGTATSTVTLTSLGNFAGNVTLSLHTSSGGTASLDKTTVPIAANGINYATLTVTLTGSAVDVNVTGTYGPLSHTVTVSVYLCGNPCQQRPQSLVRPSQSVTVHLTSSQLGYVLDPDSAYSPTVTTAFAYTTTVRLDSRVTYTSFARIGL